MNINQAVSRLEARAAQLREEGNHAAAHDWQRDASDLRRLWARAENTPPPNSKKRRGQ